MSDSERSNEDTTPIDSDSVGNGDEDADSVGQHSSDATRRFQPTALDEATWRGTDALRRLQPSAIEEARKKVPPKGLAKISKRRTDAFGNNANMLISNNRRLSHDVNAFPSSHKLHSAILADTRNQASAHREDTEQTITLSQKLNQLNVKIAFYVH